MVEAYYPETESYKTDEEIRKRLCYILERRKIIPMKKRDMRLRYGEMTLELLLLHTKLRIVSGMEGEIKKRRLRRATERHCECKLLMDELARYSNNKHMIRFVKRYKSCHS